MEIPADAMLFVLAIPFMKTVIHQKNIVSGKINDVYAIVFVRVTLFVTVAMVRKMKASGKMGAALVILFARVILLEEVEEVGEVIGILIKNLNLKIMKRITISLILLSMSTLLYSQSFLQLTGGLKIDGISNSKDTYDSFNKGLGMSLESGFVLQNEKIYMGAFGMDFYRNKNSLGTSSINCSFLTFYFFPLDWRFDIYNNSSGNLSIFTSATIAPQLCYPEGTDGVDYSWIYATSIGVKYRLDEIKILMFQIRPYLVSGNQFIKDASFPGGVEFKVSLGWDVWNFR